MTRLLSFALALLFSARASATIAPQQYCQAPTTAVAGLALTSDRPFTWKADRNGSAFLNFPMTVLLFQLVDANASILKLRITCTVSNDDSVTVYTAQDWTPSSGVYAGTNTGIFEKGDGTTGPGTLNFPIRLDTNGFPDGKCTVAVVSGAATAIIDTITAYVERCTGP